MKLTTNTDFFKKKESQTTSQRVADKSVVVSTVSLPTTKTNSKCSAEVAVLMTRTVEELKKCGFAKMSARVGQINRDVANERFVISVVGEFNHGKSTFLNNLLDNAAMLPVDTLPTTAILTRIRYAEQSKMAVFDERGNCKETLDIKPESWKGLVADNFGKEEPKGSVIIGIPDAWLGKYNIELIDCPGANDLSEERAKVIGDVLNRSDGAVITLNATAALSNSEKLFIRNRILSSNTPFTLIIVNKLDLVNKEERCQVIKYIKDLLALNKMDIPVFIPADIEMTDNTYGDIIGLDKVRDAIVGWTEDTNRQQLTDIWIKTRIADIVNMALDALTEQEKVLKLDEEKRQEIIGDKKLALGKLKLEWNDLALQLQSKSKDCYSSFLNKVDEYANDITERLQYEASHAGNPEKWWKEDYPYRLKVELANMSVGLENYTVKIITNDANWFNELLNRRFHSVIQVGGLSVTDKEEYKSNKSKRDLQFDNLSKKQTYARIGTVVLSLALAPAFGLIATMGVGTAGTLASMSFFRARVEEQRKDVKRAIAQDIPQIVLQATANSEKRIQTIYDDMLADCNKKKEAWLESQAAAIEMENSSNAGEQLVRIAANITALSDIYNQLTNTDTKK